MNKYILTKINLKIKIYLYPIRDNKVKVFTGNDWIFKNKEELINDLVDGKYFILDSHFDEVYDDLMTLVKQDTLNSVHFLMKEIKKCANNLKRNVN